MEDYEKKYNEALERARGLCALPADKAMLEEIFPELKESEDEWIRKHIIKILDNLAPCHWDGNEKARCLAYLERQKDECQRQYILGVEAGREEVLYELEKQKPAEWSEEDEKIRQSLINDLENAETEDEDVQKELNEMVAWLKSLRAQPHWKPSEEQIGILGKVFAGCQLKDSERDSMVDLFYHLKDMI